MSSDRDSTTFEAEAEQAIVATSDPGANSSSMQFGELLLRIARELDRIQASRKGRADAAVASMGA